MSLIDVKRHDGVMTELYKVVSNNLSKCISLNRSIVDIHFDIAKTQLQKAFEASGLTLEEINDG